jgi:hypothetical protein
MARGIYEWAKLSAHSAHVSLKLCPLAMLPEPVRPIANPAHGMICTQSLVLLFILSGYTMYPSDIYEVGKEGEEEEDI